MIYIYMCTHVRTLYHCRNYCIYLYTAMEGEPERERERERHIVPPGLFKNLPRSFPEAPELGAPALGRGRQRGARSARPGGALGAGRGAAQGAWDQPYQKGPCRYMVCTHLHTCIIYIYIVRVWDML